jgi:hypothetical protein
VVGDADDRMRSLSRCSKWKPGSSFPYLLVTALVGDSVLSLLSPTLVGDPATGVIA